MLSPGLTPSLGISDMAPRAVGAASPQGGLFKVLGYGEAQSPGSGLELLEHLLSSHRSFGRVVYEPCISFNPPINEDFSVWHLEAQRG